MTASSPIAAVLLDIEGTTTPIDFVYKTLFNYARTHVKDFLAAHLSSPELRADIAGLLEENAQDSRRGLGAPKLEGPIQRLSPDDIVAYVHWLMDRDRKTTPLKSLQGKIWEAGYNSGDLTSEVFDDVPRAFTRWREQGRRIYIYSSGSVLAQKLLFASTQFGDLTSFISGYFDTQIGAKRDAESYGRIAATLNLQPSEMLFVSDVTDELDAATAAGLATLLCVRAGNHPQTGAENHTAVHSFDQILP